MAVLQLTESGLYCPAGDFYIDPWRRVDRAVITHGHSDHCRWGMGRYLCAEPGLAILRARLGKDAPIDPIAYGDSVTINGVRVSLHPAGHILGSAQVRVEVGGEVWVVAGDYKTEPDPTCAPFELVRCHGFVTESTFGLPIYRWKPQKEVFAEINDWRHQNRTEGKCSVLLGYSLGKAQRLLAGLVEGSPIVVHGAVAEINDAYRWAGIRLPSCETTSQHKRGHTYRETTVVAPPGVVGSPWLRSLGPCSIAFASGWMALRGRQKSSGIDRGFALSDHVDWQSMLDVIAGTGASQILVTHGYSAQVVRYLQEQGVNARVLETPHDEREEA